MDKTASIFDTLERLKTYTEFESVTVSADGAVSVKYAQRSQEKKPAGKADKPKPTAVDSLSLAQPTFPFKAGA